MHYYFMGICGTAMGNVAVLLKQLGHLVSGADSGIYPPMSEVLRQNGIAVLDGYDPERLQRLAPDCVVVGNVIARGNAEVEWLLNTRQYPMVSLPQLIGEQLIGPRDSVVVTGTHGKTTTTSLIAHLLQRMGCQVGWMIGGVPVDLPSGAQLGDTAEPFVIEGDEYDSAFFDKRSKFIHYRPKVLLCNNLEFDHADIFRDLDDIKRTFRHVIRLVPQNGCVVYNGDDPHLCELLPVGWTRCQSVGTGETCDWRIVDFSETASGSRFTLLSEATEPRSVAWQQHGLYNARNAAMAVAALHALRSGSGLQGDRLTQDLEAFRGVRRRQERHHSCERLTVIEDFAHHPTALTQVIEAVRRRYPQATVVACFEPRSNTARRNVFQEAFATSLALADHVYLAPIADPGKFPVEARLNTELLATEIEAKGTHARACAENAELLDAVMGHVTTSTRPNVVLMLTNGSFGGILPKLTQFANQLTSDAR